MDISNVKTENGKVSYETPEGTVVHININQRSAFDCLLDTFKFIRDMKKPGQKPKSPHPTGSAGYLGFGVAYVSLGLVSIMLAIIIAVVRPQLSIFYTQVHFWVGFPFLISGILNIVAYKLPKRCWMVLAFISLLVNFSVSIAAMVFAVSDIQYSFWYLDRQDVCSNLLQSGRGSYDRATMYPRYYNSDNDYNLERCRDSMRSYKMVMQGLVLMTLLMMIWGLCLAIFSVGYRLKSFCCSCNLQRMEEKDDSLIKSNPVDGIIIA